MDNLLKNYCSYNLWANKRMAGLFDKEPVSLLQQEFKSSFPSVWKTILHIWDAETIWLNRLQGHSLQAFPGDRFTGDKNELFYGWINTSGDFKAFIHQQEPAFFSSTISFRNLSGTAFQHSACDIIQHCMNHSSFHRGQLVTLARQLSLSDIPPTDLIFYHRLT